MANKIVKAMSGMLMPLVREMASAIGVVAILFFSAHSVYAQVSTPPEWQGAANQAFFNTLNNGEGGTVQQAKQAYYGSLQGTQNQAVAATNGAIDEFNNSVLQTLSQLPGETSLVGLTMVLPNIANTTAAGLNALKTFNNVQTNWTSQPIPPPPTLLEQGPASASNTPIQGNASLLSAVGTGSSAPSSMPSSVSPSPIPGNNVNSQQYQQTMAGLQMAPPPSSLSAPLSPANTVQAASFSSNTTGNNTALFSATGSGPAPGNAPNTATPNLLGKLQATTAAAESGTIMTAPPPVNQPIPPAQMSAMMQNMPQQLMPPSPNPTQMQNIPQSPAPSAMPLQNKLMSTTSSPATSQTQPTQQTQPTAPRTTPPPPLRSSGTNGGAGR